VSASTVGGSSRKVLVWLTVWTGHRGVLGRWSRLKIRAPAPPSAEPPSAPRSCAHCPPPTSYHTLTKTDGNTLALAREPSNPHAPPVSPNQGSTCFGRAAAGGERQATRSEWRRLRISETRAGRRRLAEAGPGLTEHHH